jgi:phosphate transport system ATP-binding protein
MSGANLPAGEVRGLTVSFGDRVVLRDLDLAFEARRITVLIGRSGSGKTTFLRTLNRLNDCFPGCAATGSVLLRLARGTVDVLGLREADLPDLRRRVGMVFQTPNVLPASIRKNFHLPLSLVSGLDRAGREERMVDSLAQARLWEEVRDRLDAPATSLSGGQQQRLCLARTLALEPEILLLDEPTASADHHTTARLEETLLALKERYTLVVVSHGLGQARRLADAVAVFREGRAMPVLDPARIREKGGLESCLEDDL